MVPLSAGVSTLGPHPMLKLAPLYRLVDLGPLFLFGTARLIVLIAFDHIEERGFVLVLALMSILIAFLSLTMFSPNMALRKGIKVLQLSLVILGADACVAYLSGSRSGWLVAACVGSIAAGSVTLGTDMFQYTDLLGQRTQSTVYFSLSEMNASEWIRTHTLWNAVLQELDEVRPGRDSSIPASRSSTTFGGRRALCGDYMSPELFQVTDGKINARRRKLEHLFTADGVLTACRVLEDLSPDYLYVDEHHPGLIAIWRLQSLGVLHERYAVDGIHVFMVN